MKLLNYLVTTTAGIFCNNINSFTLFDNLLLLTSYNEYIIFYDLIKKKIVKKINSTLKNKKNRFFIINHFFVIFRTYITVIVLNNGMLFAWNLKLNKCLFSLSTNNVSISCSIFLNYKKLIITGDSNGFINIWSVLDKKKVTYFVAHQEKICNIDYFSNENYLITSTYNTVIKFWSLNKIYCIAIFTTYTIQKISIAINPHLGIILSSKNNKISAFKLNSLNIIRFPKNNLPYIHIRNYVYNLFKNSEINLPILSIMYAFSKKLTILKLGNNILYNLKIKILKNLKNTHLNIKKNNKKFFNIFYIKMLQFLFFYDVKFYNFKILYKKMENTKSLFLIFISTTFNIYMIAENKKKLIVLELLNFFIHKSNIIHSAYSLNTSFFFTITKKTFRLWTADKFNIKNINFLEKISTGNFYLNARVFLYGDVNGIINYLNTNNNCYRKICYGHNTEVYSINLLLKSNLIFSYSIDSNLKIWKNKFLKKDFNFTIVLTLFKSLVFTIEPVELLASANEVYLIASFIDHTMKLYLIPSIKYCFSFDTHNEIIITSSFSMDSNYLLGGSLNGYIFVWRINSPIILHSRKSHTGPIHQIKYYKNDTIIICIGISNFIMIWNSNFTINLKRLPVLQKNPFILLINNKFNFIISIALDNSLKKIKIITFDGKTNSTIVGLKKQKKIELFQKNFFEIIFTLTSRKTHNINNLLEHTFYQHCKNTLIFFNLTFIKKVLKNVYKTSQETILKILLKWIITYRNINLALNFLIIMFNRRTSSFSFTQRCFLLLSKIHLICLIYIGSIKHMLF